jgi:uncharacterized protein YpmB
VRKLVSAVTIAAFLVVGLSLVAAQEKKDDAKEGTWTGWISDSNCAAKGMDAKHKDCAIKCVKEKGAKWVFVTTADKKVHEIKNQDGVSENDLGHEVKVSGHLYKDGSVHVMKVAPAS